MYCSCPVNFPLPPLSLINRVACLTCVLCVRTLVRKQTAAKYAMVMKTNKKLSAEIDKYRALVSKGETELHISPPSKRIRLHLDKLA